jgi:hypothetical protein
MNLSQTPLHSRPKLPLQGRGNINLPKPCVRRGGGGGGVGQVWVPPTSPPAAPLRVSSQHEQDGGAVDTFRRQIRGSRWQSIRGTHMRNEAIHPVHWTGMRETMVSLLFFVRFHCSNQVSKGTGWGTDTFHSRQCVGFRSTNIFPPR